MIPNLDAYTIDFLVGDNADLMESQPIPFSDEIIGSLTGLGQFLMSYGRDEPDIIAAGFWLRKSHLLNLKKQYNDKPLFAKGCVFHIAPGNVDTLFFYSIILSILCGNYSILRINNNLSPLATGLIELINGFIKERPETDPLRQLMCIIQYPHNDEITVVLSKSADVRVIWGGDKTVNQLSRLPIKPDGINVTFPDRYSVTVIELQAENQIPRAVEKLMADIRPYYQQACSSPKVIYWLNTDRAIQQQFWLLLGDKLLEKLELTGSEIISQLVYLQRLPLLNKHGIITHKQFNNLHIVEMKNINRQQIDQHCGFWIMLSQQIDALEALRLFEHCQTVTMYGVNERIWQQWLETTSQPMKRWVTAGQALVFSHRWDGVDLIEKFVGKK